MQLIFYTALISAALLLQANIPALLLYCALGLYYFLRLPRAPGNWNFPLVCGFCFCGFVLLYLPWAYDFSGALREFLRYFFLFFLFLELGDPLKKTLAEKILILVIGIAFLMGLGGIYQVFLDTEPMPLSWAATPGVEPLLKRAFGLFDNPNLFGTFLLISAFSTTYFWLEKGQKYMSPLTGFLWFILVLTQSRGALIGALISLLVLLLLGSKKYRISLTLIVTLILAGFFISGRASTLVVQDLGVNQRWELIKGSLHMVKAHWLTGTSPGSFHLFYPEFRTVGGYYPLHVHNHFLETWLELGISGALMLLCFWISLANFFLKSPGACWAFALFLGISVNSMFNQSLSFFSIAACALIGLIVMAPNSSLDWRPLKKIWLVPFFLIAAFLFCEIQKMNFLRDFDGKLQLGPDQYPVYLRTDLYVVSQMIDRVLTRLELEGADQSLGTLELCEKWLRPLLDRYSHEGEIPYLMHRIFRLRSQWRLAELMLNLALERDPHSEKYAVGLMENHLHHGRFNEVIRLGEMSLKSNPGYRRINPWYDQVQLLLFRAYLASGNLDQLKKEIESAIWIDENLGEQIRSNMLHSRHGL